MVTMNTNDGLVLIFTGSKVNIAMIKSELEINGILSMEKDGFKQGVEAGFAGGIPDSIDLFVKESDVVKATEIIKAITE